MVCLRSERKRTGQRRQSNRSKCCLVNGRWGCSRHRDRFRCGRCGRSERARHHVGAWQRSAGRSVPGPSAGSSFSAQRLLQRRGRDEHRAVWTTRRSWRVTVSSTRGRSESRRPGALGGTAVGVGAVKCCRVDRWAQRGRVLPLVLPPSGRRSGEAWRSDQQSSSPGQLLPPPDWDMGFTQSLASFAAVSQRGQRPGRRLSSSQIPTWGARTFGIAPLTQSIFRDVAAASGRIIQISAAFSDPS